MISGYFRGVFATFDAPMQRSFCHWWLAGAKFLRQRRRASILRLIVGSATTDTIAEERPAPLLAAEGLCLQRDGVAILDSVDMSIRRGEIVTIIGPNGAGKTSLLRLLLGLTQATGGTVRRAPGLRIGYLPQQPHIDPILPLTVARFLSMSRGLAPGRGGAALVRAVAEETGIAHRLAAPLQGLSGGERQRALLARALLSQPDVLILDEPTSHVDFAGQTAFYELLTGLRQRRGCGILLVSHDLHVVMGATDMVICLDRHVCCSGAAEHIAQHPEYARLFAPEIARTRAIYVHHHPAGHEREHES